MSIEASNPTPSKIIAPGVEVQKAESGWTNVQVDSQVLSMFMSCERKYEYVQIRRLRPVEKISKSIRRGSIVHDGLLEYWKEVIATGDYQTAVKACLEKCKEALAKQDDMEPDYKLETMQGVLQFLQHIQTMSWIPLAAEKYFRIKAVEDAAYKIRTYLTGRIDLIMKTPQIPVLPIDNKTETERWFHSQMSNQFKIYCIATQTNLLGVQRVGFQKTLEPKDKFKLETLPFDQDILDEFREITLVHWVRRMMIAHEENYFPMNPTNCVHGHFKCQFSDGTDHKGICNVSRAVREQKLARYFYVGEEWDPANPPSM